MATRTQNSSKKSTHYAYQIKLEGHLNQKWQLLFDGFTILLEQDGTTCLTGLVVDQAALYGLLRKVRDLGLPLISINRLPIENETKER